MTPRTYTARAGTLAKALLGAVLAAAAMFHGPAFSADPKPLKVGVRIKRPCFLSKSCIQRKQ